MWLVNHAFLHSAVTTVGSIICLEVPTIPSGVHDCNEWLNLAATLRYAETLRHHSIAINGPDVYQLNGPETSPLACAAVTMHHLSIVWVICVTASDHLPQQMVIHFCLAEYTLHLRVHPSDTASSKRYSGECNKTLTGYKEQNPAGPYQWDMEYT